MHEIIREHSLHAWDSLRKGQDSPLMQTMLDDARVTTYVAAETLPDLLDASAHIGDAPQRARALARTIRATIDQGEDHDVKA
jgi:adenylosuccinate lyase